MSLLGLYRPSKKNRLGRIIAIPSTTKIPIIPSAQSEGTWRISGSVPLDVGHQYDRLELHENPGDQTQCEDHEVPFEF